jgi:hypothetical protein
MSHLEDREGNGNFQSGTKKMRYEDINVVDMAQDWDQAVIFLLAMLSIYLY